MLILSTIKPNEKLMDQVSKAFPEDEFAFYKTMDEANHELHKAEILITYGEDLTPSLIEQAETLKWIMVMSAGLEKMPFREIKEKGILVTNARGIHKIPMAEYTLSMMLQVVKQNKQLIQQQKDHNWNRTGIPITELNEKTLCILGVGAIGGEIARLGKAFNMRVLGVNTSGQAHESVDRMYKVNELENILPEAEFLVSVLPSTHETKYLMKEEHFNLMKEESVFINIGRGDLVEEEILLDALRKKKISHAVLDVFEREPLPGDHPFWEMEMVTVTPHISSKSEQYLPRCFEIFEKNLQEYKKGGNHYINQIDLERGY